MEHVKGMHEARGLPIGNLMHLNKGNDGKLTSKLARLDHQRGLLERQLAVWTQKQKVTGNRLALLLKEIAEVEKRVREQRGAGGRMKRRKSACVAKPRHGQHGTSTSQRDFSVEY